MRRVIADSDMGRYDAAHVAPIQRQLQRLFAEYLCWVDEVYKQPIYLVAGEPFVDDARRTDVFTGLITRIPLQGHVVSRMPPCVLLGGGKVAEPPFKHFAVAAMHVGPGGHV